MTRKFALLILAASLAFTGCDKIPGFKKKPVVQATPTPASTASAPGSSAGSTSASGTESAKEHKGPSAPPVQVVDTHASVMVLCFHNIEDKSGMKALTITVAEFERELNAIKDKGFTVIPMQDFLAWRRSEKNIPAKSCVITIDDGWVSGYTIAWPILKKMGYPFTMFVYINYIGTGGKSISWDQLAEMRDAGVDIQCHTYYHGNLRAPGTGVDAKTKAAIMKEVQTVGKDGYMRKEIIESKKILEDRLGIKVNALAYPFGNYNAEARALVKEAGYEAAFTVYGQRLAHSAPFDLLGRYAVETAKPAIFENSLTMLGGGVSPEDNGPSAMSQLAATSMITEPPNGENITDPTPTIKANLEAMGVLDDGTVAMRIGGLGPVQAKYDKANNTISYTVTTPLKPNSYRVFITAKSNGRPVETSWNFTFYPNGVPPAPETPAAPVATPEPKKKKK